MPNSTIAIILPTYNESENIASAISQIKHELPNASIFVVDDKSPDGTAEVVKKLQRKTKNLYLVNNPNKGGRGKAVMAGFQKAIKYKQIKIFIEMDADLQHQPSELKNLIKIVRKNSQTIAIASRYMKGGNTINWSLHRKIFSLIANNFLYLFLGFKLSDYTNGFRAYPREAIEHLCECQLVSTSYVTLSESALIMHHAKFKFKEVPCVFPQRVKGKSNADLNELKDNLVGLYKINRKYHCCFSKLFSS